MESVRRQKWARGCIGMSGCPRPRAIAGRRRRIPKSGSDRYRAGRAGSRTRTFGGSHREPGSNRSPRRSRGPYGSGGPGCTGHPPHSRIPRNCCTPNATDPKDSLRNRLERTDPRARSKAPHRSPCRTRAPRRRWTTTTCPRRRRRPCRASSDCFSRVDRRVVCFRKSRSG